MDGILISNLDDFSGSPSTGDYLAIDNGTNTTRIDAIKLARTGCEGIVASAYEETTYAVGDYVIYENSLYKCVAEISTAEEWTASHWEQVILADDIIEYVDTEIKASQDYVIDGILPTDTASGAIASFPDGTSVFSAKSVLCDIEPIQGGSGTPSPSNVRPISGHDGVVVSVSPTTSASDATVYSVSFASAGTVYGGEVDVVSGVLTVDRAMVDLGTLNWTKRNTSSGHFRFTANADIYMPSSTSALPNIICSAYPTITPDASWLGVSGASCNNSAQQILISDENYTDATSFKTAMNGVQVVYELATPQTYQLTPTEVDLLLGQNNVWNDCGDTEVTYKADVALYVEKKLS